MNKLYFAFALLLVTCEGCNWRGSHYLGLYEIDGTDDHRYLVDTAKNKIVLDEQVLDVGIREHYLLILRERAQSYECGPSGQKTIFTDYSGQLEYWVIDAASGEKVGPLDLNGYAAFLKSHALKSAELNQTSYYVPSVMPSRLQKSCEPIGP